MRQEISPLLWLHGECDAALNVWNEIENQYIFHLLHFGFDDREFVYMAFDKAMRSINSLEDLFFRQGSSSNRVRNPELLMNLLIL